mgnify:CR=1 FL=1
MITYCKRILSLLAVMATTCTAAAADEIVVGGKNFTEQQLMAQITSELLKAKGYDVDTRSGMGSAALRQAQENGQIDVYWEYTGTSLITYNKVEERMSPEKTYDKVKELDAEKGLVWLDPSSANNTYALAMNKDEAEKMGMTSISDLAAKVKDDGDIDLACNAEFYARADGLKPLQEVYGFEFDRSNIKRMDTGLTYQALKENEVDVALVFATDGRIPAFDFVLLEDDKEFFPSYALTPVIRKETLDKNPEIAEHLNAVSAKLNDETMAQLNAAVDVEKKTIEDVAQSFLKNNGLI